MENYEKIFGRNAVKELIKGNREIAKIYVNENYEGSLSVIVGMAKEKGVFVQKTNVKKLDFFANGANHQGVVAFTVPFQFVGIEDILEIAKEKNEKPFIVILDDIEDPHNAGALIRSAYCAGAHGVIMAKRRSANISEGVYKSSAGAIEHISIAQVANLTNTIEKLKKEGVFIVGLDLDGEAYDKIDYDMPLGLVVGSEGKGLSRLVKASCDFIATIPILGMVDSLNASVAGGIVIYEALKHRKK